MTKKTDYRMVRLIDGSTIVGSITVDKDFLRITDALELKTMLRHTSFGVKEDTTLTPWLPYTEDKLFVIPRDKVLIITQANPQMSHYYEVILNKLEKSKKQIVDKPPLSVEEIENIYSIANEMEKIVGQREEGIEWEQEEDLFDSQSEDTFFGKKTIH